MHQIYFELLGLKKNQGRNLLDIYSSFTSFSLTLTKKNIIFSQYEQRKFILNQIRFCNNCFILTVYNLSDTSQ